MRSLEIRLVAMFALACMGAGVAGAVTLHAPADVIAGQSFQIQTSGSGDATFYLLGPASAFKQMIHLGTDIEVQSKEVVTAGQYQAVVCASDDCSRSNIQVNAGLPARMSFFLHPSRVPVSTPNAIDATVFVFDRYYNPVFAATKVEFQIAPLTAAGFSQAVTAQRGISWMRMGSSSKGGPVRVTAAIPGLAVPRLIQQVAAEACGLHMKAVPGKTDVTLETDPVHDCSGNPLPDGTIVSFTAIDSAGETTVDAPIKKSVARTRLSLRGRARISVACGVVLGNELSITGGA